MVTTGESHLVLPGGPAVDHISLRLTESLDPSAQFVGTMYPRGLWHIGSAGLGSFPDDTIGASPAYIHWYRFLRHEHELWYVDLFAGRAISSGSVFWRWMPGVTVELEVFW